MRESGMDVSIFNRSVVKADALPPELTGRPDAEYFERHRTLHFVSLCWAPPFRRAQGKGVKPDMQHSLLAARRLNRRSSFRAEFVICSIKTLQVPRVLASPVSIDRNGTGTDACSPIGNAHFGGGRREGAVAVSG
jgi:hypothetical protein